jgi:NO-binding membrane sensor protein with MHYT domain
MLQVFYLDITYVALAIHICCKCMFQRFQLFQSLLQVFYLDVTYVALAIHVCCKFMFQMIRLFQTYVVGVLSRCCICYTGYTHILQVYCQCFVDRLVNLYNCRDAPGRR